MHIARRLKRTQDSNILRAANRLTRMNSLCDWNIEIVLLGMIRGFRAFKAVTFLIVASNSIYLPGEVDFLLRLMEHSSLEVNG